MSGWRRRRCGRSDPPSRCCRQYRCSSCCRCFRSGPVQIRTRQDIVLVRALFPAVHKLAKFVQLGFPGHVVVVTVQVGNAGRHLDAADVVPGTVADPVTRVDAIRTRRGQIRTPCLLTRADTGGQRLAMGIGAGQTAEVGAISGVSAGDKEAEIVRRRLRRRGQGANAKDDDQRTCQKHCFLHIVGSPIDQDTDRWPIAGPPAGIVFGGPLQPVGKTVGVRLRAPLVHGRRATAS